MVETPEHDRQRRLTKLGLATLIAAPIIGPVALVAGGAIFAGKAARHMFNDEAEKDYINEKKHMKAEKNKTNQPKNYFPSPYNESPETAIARVEQCPATALIDKTNARMEYTRDLAAGTQIANHYINSLSQKERDAINEIEIYPQVRKSILGIPYGKKRLEVKVRK